jgi:acetyl esterase/lipase
VTRIYVGSRDPFSDDCYRLTERLMKENVKVQMTVYQSFSHGFLQFDNILMPIMEARQAVTEICSDMEKCLIDSI